MNVAESYSDLLGNLGFLSERLSADSLRLRFCFLGRSFPEEVRQALPTLVLLPRQQPDPEQEIQVVRRPLKPDAAVLRRLVVMADRNRELAADLREEPTPGWEIANLRGGIQRGALSVTAGVTNLFDRTYHEHLSYQRDPFRSGVVVYEPGRSFFINAGYRF